MLTAKKQKGFSLAEVLMATGILALGMAFIAGVFPAGIHYTIISTERTMAAVVADEAFTKIRLYGVDVNLPPPAGTGKLPDVLGGSLGFWEFLPTPILPIQSHREFLYPSDIDINPDDSDKQYCWSALCRRIMGARPGDTLVQVTVFVCRKTAATTNYWRMSGAAITDDSLWPVPVKVNVTAAANGYNIRIIDNNQRTFITVGGMLIDNISGSAYRVLRRDPDDSAIVELDKPWKGPTPSAEVWAVPAAVGGGRYPVIGVFQREILF